MDFKFVTLAYPERAMAQGEREAILQTLRQHTPSLRKRGVLELMLFGSVARGDANDGLDVDIAADLAPDHTLSLLDFVRIERELAESLGRQVDFVSLSGLKPAIRRVVDRAAVRAF